ncbi:MAG: radical SAM family heme chaperone HemW [Spirochaetaceae bacterium]
MNLKSSKISLYIHIPFCSSKCKYCDFYSETIDFERIPKVITEIIEQFKYWNKKLNSPLVETIFIGGGTPSMLPIPELSRLLSFLHTSCPNLKEFSIESNPESITKEFINVCNNFGVNRLSIGIQSFNNITLSTLGRESTLNIIEKAMLLVKKYWVKQFSIDLISSVPYQNKKMITMDIKKALEYNPDHISFYALSLEEGTVLEDEVSKGLLEALEDDLSEDIWLEGRSLLKAAGYNNYEVSNYTKKYPCLHNINYWELKPYLGIGPGAVSTLLDENDNLLRVTNSKSIKTFLKGKDQSWGEDVELLSPKNFFEDYVIMGLRLKKGVDIKRFYEIFKKNIGDCIPITEDLINEGSLIINTDYYKLTDDGFDIMNDILVRILTSIEEIQIDSVNWFY